MKTPLFRAGLKRDWETGKTVLGCRLTGLGYGEIRTGKRIYPLLVTVVPLLVTVSVCAYLDRLLPGRLLPSLDDRLAVGG